MTTRRRLTDILHETDRENLQKAWATTQAAGEFAPLPPGEYLVRCLTGEVTTSRSGKPSYKLTMEVADGDHAGRRVWHDHYLTAAALPMAKRDLGKLGITSLEQLDQPLPAGILLRVRLAVRRDDDGTERSRVVKIEAAGIEAPDAFALDDDPDTSFDPATFEDTESGGPTASTSTAALDEPPPPSPPPPSTPNMPSTPTKPPKNRSKRNQVELPLSDGAGPYAEGR